MLSRPISRLLDLRHKSLLKKTMKRYNESLPLNPSLKYPPDRPGSHQ